MNEITVIIGTRPEAIKLLPLVMALRRAGVAVSVLCTGQHAQMLECVFNDFSLYPDYRFESMHKGQSLTALLFSLASGFDNYFSRCESGDVIVQGDTASAYMGAVCAYLSGRVVYHVEAGLRTHNVYSPYPEEFFRQSISKISALHFAPTVQAAENLISEGVAPDSVFVTGNTVLDAMAYLMPKAARIEKKLVFTLHRRENRCAYKTILKALARFATRHPELSVVYPHHPSPEISRMAHSLLGGISNITLTASLSPRKFYSQLITAELVLTDSGGIQEECAAIGVPTLVMRDTTERTAELIAGKIELIGKDPDKIFSRAEELLGSDVSMRRGYAGHSPSVQICELIMKNVR